VPAGPVTSPRDVAGSPGPGAGIGGPVGPGTPVARLQQFVLRFVLRRALDLYTLLVSTLRAVTRGAARANPGTYDILLTGKFFSENWILNHLRPLAASRTCSRLQIVCTYPIPPLDKVAQIRPWRFLSRLVGEDVARLLTFFWVGWRDRPDLVGGFNVLVNGLAASVLGRMIGCRTLCFCGGGPREVLGGGFASENRLFGKLATADPVLEQQLLKAVDDLDALVAMGNRTVDFFNARRTKTRLVVIPGGIDSALYRRDGEAKTYDLILVGRLAAVKRVDLFLRTVARLRGQFPRLSAVIVGTGELEAELKALAAELGLENCVEFAGFQREVAGWLQRSRLFVLTSDSEGLALSLMEAMMCGLPAIVSDVGELGELVTHGDNGYLVTERSPEAFAGYAAKLLADAACYHRFAERARRAALRCDVPAATRAWEQFLAVL